MTIVVDANVLVATVLPLPYSTEAETLVESWIQRGETLIAPSLQVYEMTTALRSAVAQRWLTTSEAADVLDDLLSVDIRHVEPSLALARRSLEWSERLGQRASYDAAYLAVAESESADLWTADKRLGGAARRLGVDWVHLVGEQ